MMGSPTEQTAPENDLKEENVELDLSHVDTQQPSKKGSWIGRILGVTPEPGETPLPWSKLAVAVMVSFGEGINTTILLPFVVYMIKDLFHYPQEQVGYYGGWIVASYFLAQIFSSVMLGQLSDIEGRRPIILLGIATNSITTLMFGMSRQFWLALLSRFLCGALNGNIGVVKSYIREITDSTNQARAYVLRSSGYSVGTLIGPLLGGVLARPAIQYPNTFSSTGLFAYFPFLLPCLFSATVSAVAFCIGYKFMPETVVFDHHIVDSNTISSSSNDDKNHDDSDEIELEEQDPKKKSLGDQEKIALDLDEANLPPSSLSSNSTSSLSPSSSTSLPTSPQQPLTTQTQSVNQSSTTRNDQEDEGNHHLDNNLPDFGGPVIQSRRLIKFQAFITTLRERLAMSVQALKDKDVIISVLLYACVSFLMLGFDEIFAFWANSGFNFGGLSFTSIHIGIAHAVSAVGMLFMQWIVYVPLDNFFGTRHALCVSMIPLGIAISAMPFTHSLYDHRVILWITVGILMMIKAGFSTIAFAAANLLVSNAAGPGTIGAVNGLSASVAAASRVVAPVLLGSIYSATTNSGVGFPIDYHFAFFCATSVAGFVAFGGHYLLPPSINQRKM